LRGERKSDLLSYNLTGVIAAWFGRRRATA
jgi:hypothetical protein